MIEKKNVETQKMQEQLIEVQKQSIKELDLKVEEKTRDIRSILVNIEQGIFTVKDELKIEPAYSPFLEVLLQEQGLAIRG